MPPADVVGQSALSSATLPRIFVTRYTNKIGKGGKPKHLIFALAGQPKPGKSTKMNEKGGNIETAWS
jgi:hypothetical protein